MKNLFNIAFLLGISISLVSFTTPATSLVGKWKGEDDGEIGFITFDKEGYVAFITEGQTLGGKKYTMDGMVFDMYYETDDTVTPNTIDFIIKLHEGQVEVTRMTGIYKFVNNKTLLLNMNFSEGERPALFDPEDPNQITLHKIK
jgi:hypothetical protein